MRTHLSRPVIVLGTFLYLWVSGCTGKDEGELVIESRSAGDEITEQARQCSGVEDIFDRIQCFVDRALEAKTFTACDEANEQAVRYQCYAVFAERAETAIPCRQIPTSDLDYRQLRDVCLADVAAALGSSALCEEIESDGLRDGCWLSTSHGTGNQTLCERIEDPQLHSLCTGEPVYVN